MWVFKISTGEICQDDDHVAWGYSGRDKGKNNPDMQDAKGVGPIPVGIYDIWSPRNTESHGPYVLPLYPHSENEMHGRDGFLIHGDSITAPGTASHGCIIASKLTRLRIWESGDHVLKVTP